MYVQAGDLETQRQFIFDAYVERMFERPGRSKNPINSANQTLYIGFLGWLGR